MCKQRFNHQVLLSKVHSKEIDVKELRKWRGGRRKTREESHIGLHVYLAFLTGETEFVLFFNGAGKFCHAHELRQLTHNVKSDVRI